MLSISLMANSSRIKPKRQHWELYERRPYREPALALGQMIKRTGLIVLVTVVVTLVGPFVPSRQPSHHIPTTGEEYVAGLGPGLLIAVLIAIGLVYEYILNPLKNQRLGYRLVGRFVVQGKQKFLGSAWLEFAPDDLHRVGIAPEEFGRFQKGDTVEVVYSATEDFVSLRKINESTARP